MQKIKHLALALGILLTLHAPLAQAASPLTMVAAKCHAVYMLTVPAWYNNLQCNGSQPTIGKLNDVWVIALNLIEAIIGVAAYVAVVLIIWNGFRFIKSRGDPGKITEAKSGIFNSVIGLGIVFASAAIVRFVQGLIS